MRRFGRLALIGLLAFASGCGGGAAGAGEGGGSGGGGASGEAGAAQSGGGAGDRAGADATPDAGGQPDGGQVPAGEQVRPARAALGCPTDDSGAAGRAVFEIPRAGELTDDFFRLPFPSDLRQVGGRLQLGEVPRPGVRVPPLDLVDRYIQALGREEIGFGLSPSVFFRISRAPRLDGAAVSFFDVTEGSPTYGREVPARVRLAPVSRYVCGAALVVEPESRVPLLPGQTYAVWVHAGLTDARGRPFAADLELGRVLADRAPVAAEAAAAWAVHTPLRALLRRRGLDPARVLTATLFTTQRLDTLAELRAAVLAAPAPRVSELVRCGDGVPSACDDGRVPACATLPPAAGFVEYRGQVALPVFQGGTPPYELEGGGLARDAEGRPRVEREEPVCFALTLPRLPAPAAGWPLVVHAHGTGGSFRSAVAAGLAGDLAAGTLAAGAPAPAAVLGYDGVLHGARKGHSARAVEDLVYNVFNPEASRGNGLQAAADLFALVRAVPALAAGVPLDAGRLALYGHSQGGNAAALAAAHEPAFGAVVLSGTGGGLARSLLAKSQPVSVAALLPGLLGEAQAVEAGHPVLALLQTYMDAADPINHAARILAAEGGPSPHLLHVFGADDHYAPDATQRDLAQAAGLAVLAPAADLGESWRPLLVTGPVRGNHRGAAGLVTAVQAQYRPDGYDGHFVSTQHPAARRAIARMLASSFRDGVPVVE